LDESSESYMFVNICNLTNINQILGHICVLNTEYYSTCILRADPLHLEYSLKFARILHTITGVTTPSIMQRTLNGERGGGMY
jgi:hypothetical protein